MSPRLSDRTLWLLILASFALASCNVGQAVKKLGKRAVGGSGNPISDSDTFSVTLAFRNSADETAAGRRTVSIQGVRGLPSANLVNECGATGNNCTCEFFRDSSSVAVAAATVGISAQNNSFSCVIPNTISDADLTAGAVTLVKLKRSDNGAKNTGLITIKTTLVLDDILSAGSNLVKTKVRGIFRYSCNRTFFEGEGVSSSQIQCVAGQRLGVIQATYNFYIFRSGEDANSPGGDSPFPGDICKRNNFLKVQCTGNTPELRYGFYKDSVEPFVVGISMTRAPEGENLTANYGFAALPDSAGNCPTGLIKVRPFVAQPQSIIQGSLSSNPVNPPSSFINTNNSLNNTVVEQAAPTNLIVTRQPNLTACDGTTGDCTNATFAGQAQAQSVAYAALTPVVCAIPPNLLNGVF